LDWAQYSLFFVALLYRYAFVYRSPFGVVSWHIGIEELMKGDPNYFDILHTLAVLC